MTDFENNSVNEENNLQNPTSSGILSRLLKRKSSSGIVIPKIRSKIGKITKNSQKLKNQHLNLPGNTRRERIKTFGDELRNNKKTKTKTSTSEVRKTSQSSWENMEMLLPNGTSVESSRPNISQTSMDVPAGLPTGGQVITPFNPPPTSEGEPSFVARRRARLIAQEEKKIKPQTKEPDPNVRPRSRVEEIIPASRQPAEKLTEMSKPMEREKDTLTKQVNEPTEPKEQKSRDESKAQRPSQVEEIKPSAISEKAGQDKAVQRQLETSSDEKPKNQLETVSEDKSRTGKTQSTSKDISSPTVADDLNTLVQRKTSSTVESKEVKSSNPEIEKSTDKKSKNMSSPNKGTQSLPSQPGKSQINPDTKHQVEKTEQPELSAPKDVTIPKTEVEKRTNTEEKSEDQSTISKTSSSRIQREIDQKAAREVEKSKEPESIIPSEVKEKLDLPLVDKTLSKTTEKEQQDSQQKIKKRVTTESSEKQQPVPPEKVQQIHQVTAKSEDDRIVEDTTSEEKFSTDKQRVSDDQLSEPSKKPLLINKRIDLPLIKTNKNQQIQKRKQISQVLKTPVFKPVSNKSNVISSEKTLVQRLIVSSTEKIQDQPGKVVEDVMGDLGRSKSLKQTSQKIEPQKTSPKGSKELRRQPLPENLREEMVETKDKQDISPRNIPKRQFKSVIKSQKRTESLQIPKKDSLPIINRSFLPTRDSEVQRHKFTTSVNKQSISMDDRRDGSIGKQIAQTISPQTMGEKPDLQPIAKNLVQRIKEPTGKQESPFLPIPSIQDRLLVTSPGRKIIKNKIEKSVQKLDVKQTSEDKLPFIIPLSSEKDMREIGKTDELSPRKSGSKKAVSEGIKSSKTPGKSAMPVHKQVQINAPEKSKKSPEIELPVLQTKKMERQEKYFEPDFTVQGPVVQRMISESSENSEDLAQSVIREEMKIDLEKLALDVYPIIKRWIAIEKERTSGRLY